MFKKNLISFFVIFWVQIVAEAKIESANDLAISQGISSPSYTNSTTVSNGFTAENPVAASYQSQYRATAFIDGTTSTSLGLDLGLGDGKYGLGLGYYSNACDDCDGYIRGTMSAIWGSFGLGFGVQENLYTMGMLFNPHGVQRVGLVVEFEDPNGPNNRRTAWGLGYSCVLPSFTFSIDMSNRSFQDGTLDGDAIMVTPGMAVRIDIFSVSLSYDVFLNDNFNNFSHQVWVGISAKPFKDWQFTFYGEFVDRWTLMTSYYF